MSDRVYEIHPAADLFPRMSVADLADLADDIKTNGLRDAITLCGGVLLDGRDRLAACKIAGVAPRFTEFAGTSAVAFVISANIRRKHFDRSQLAAVASELVPMFLAESRATQAAMGGDKRSDKARSLSSRVTTQRSETRKQDHESRSTAKAAKATGATPRATEQMRSVASKAPEVVAVVKAGKATVADAVRVSKLPEVERAAVVDRVASGEAATLKEALATQPNTEGRKDALGRDLPDEIAEGYENRAALHADAANLNTRLVAALAKLPALGRLHQQQQQVGHEIRSAAPCTTCVHCKLHPSLRSDCEHCKGSGISTVAKFKAAIPALQVTGADAVVFAGANGARELVRLADLP